MGKLWYACGKLFSFDNHMKNIMIIGAILAFFCNFVWIEMILLILCPIFVVVCFYGGAVNGIYFAVRQVMPLVIGMMLGDIVYLFTLPEFRAWLWQGLHFIKMV